MYICYDIYLCILINDLRDKREKGKKGRETLYG